MKKTLNVLVSTDRNYLKYLRVLMVSVYENHPEQKVDFYVLHDELNAEDEAYLNEVAQMYGQKVVLLEVDPTVYDDFPFGNRWPKACLYILLAHQFLPQNMERILYLDIDTVVDDDLNKFYDMEISDVYLVAVKEHMNVANEKDFDEIPYTEVKNMDVDRARQGLYFNSGVLLFNLEKFRANQIDINYYKEVIQLADGKKIFYDQGILNLGFLQQSKVLTTCRYNYRLKFSFPDCYARKRYYNDTGMPLTFLPFQPAIIHYCGFVPKMYSKPWDLAFLENEIDTVVNKQHNMFHEVGAYFGIWWKYAEKVPDYDLLQANSQQKKSVYSMLNKFFNSYKMDTLNMLAVETLRVPSSSMNENTILANEDLNDFIVPKVYRCATGKIKSTIQNLPEDFIKNVGFRLVVKHIAANDLQHGNSVCVQILEPNLPDVPVYRRYYYGLSTTNWGPWYRMATDKDLEALKQTNAAQSEQITQLTEQLAAAQQELEAQKECIAQLETMKNEMEAQKKLIESLTKIVLS